MARHILIPTDLSPASLEILGDLSWLHHRGTRRITLFHAYQVGFPSGATPVTDDYFLPQLELAAIELRDQGFHVDFFVQEGRPATEILAAADKANVDLIVLTNRGHSALEEVLVGSTATALLEKAHKPVFLYSTTAPTPPGAEDLIIHPTDFSLPSQRAFEWAIHTAAHDHSRLLLVHILAAGGSGDDILDPDEAQRLLLPLREEALARGLDVETQIFTGRPKKSLTELLQNHPHALIAMGNHGRGFFADLMHGSVARRIARAASHHIYFAAS